MFSRCSIPKNVEKYCKSLNSIKGKWTLKRLGNHKLYEKYSPSLLFASKNTSNTNVNDKNETCTHPVVARLQLNRFKDLLKGSAKFNLLSQLNLKDKILLSSGGVSVAHTKAPATPVLDPIPERPVRQKYCKSLNYLKGKRTFKRLGNHKLYEKYSPSLLFASKDISNTNLNDKNETCTHPVVARLQLNRFKDLLKGSAKFNFLSQLNLKDKILLSSGGVSVAHTEAPAAPVLDPIPEPPVPTAEVLDAVTAAGEQPFESLGLGGWSPVGIVQTCLEYLHVSLDVPWWGAIVIGTIVVRLLMFPLVVIAQRNGARMNNYLPQLQVLQLKMTEARQTGNQLDAARYGQEMMAFMKEKQLNPLKNMIVPLAQMPLFISFFIGLRQMANCPVESMRYGGLWWFNDLTLPDQFFILPVITSLTMWLTIEVGTDTAKLSAQNLQMMKYVLRAMPLVVLPFTVNFPGAILCYWVCTNFISLGQVGVLRIPKVRDFFKIEPLITHNPENLPIKSKGFVGGMKESWTNMKITSELEGRKRYDEMQFQRAGKGPVVKTYKFDPTKQAYSAKKQ